VFLTSAYNLNKFRLFGLIRSNAVQKWCGSSFDFSSTCVGVLLRSADRNVEVVACPGWSNKASYVVETVYNLAREYWRLPGHPGWSLYLYDGRLCKELLATPGEPFTTDRRRASAAVARPLLSDCPDLVDVPVGADATTEASKAPKRPEVKPVCLQAPHTQLLSPSSSFFSKMFDSPLPSWMPTSQMAAAFLEEVPAQEEPLEDTLLRPARKRTEREHDTSAMEVHGQPEPAWQRQRPGPHPGKEGPTHLQCDLPIQLSLGDLTVLLGLSCSFHPRYHDGLMRRYSWSEHEQFSSSSSTCQK
jgi:hypothetical protein